MPVWGSKAPLVFFAGSLSSPAAPTPRRGDLGRLQMAWCRDAPGSGPPRGRWCLAVCRVPRPGFTQGLSPRPVCVPSKCGSGNTPVWGWVPAGTELGERGTRWSQNGKGRAALSQPVRARVSLRAVYYLDGPLRGKKPMPRWRNKWGWRRNAGATSLGWFQLQMTGVSYLFRLNTA